MESSLSKYLRNLSAGWNRNSSRGFLRLSYRIFTLYFVSPIAFRALVVVFFKLLGKITGIVVVCLSFVSGIKAVPGILQLF